MSEVGQIQSMIDFIEREAQEKADELDSAAQEEYDVEKMRLVEAEKSKIRANHEQKKKQVDIDRRVAQANFSKVQRLRLMDERSLIMDQLRENTKRKILGIIEDSQGYRKFLVDILCQALLAIKTNVVVFSRMEDVAIVQGMMKEIEQWYKDKVGVSISIKVSNEYLNTEESWGGLIVQSEDGHITCNSTLSSRMANCFEDQLPAIRYFLFNPEASI